MEDFEVMGVDDFITKENCFAVMARFLRLGILSKEDIQRATKMGRADWISFMRRRAGEGVRD